MLTILRNSYECSAILRVFVGIPHNYPKSMIDALNTWIKANGCNIRFKLAEIDGIYIGRGEHIRCTALRRSP